MAHFNLIDLVNPSIETVTDCLHQSMIQGQPCIQLGKDMISINLKDAFSSVIYGPNEIELYRPGAEAKPRSSSTHLYSLGRSMLEAEGNIQLVVMGESAAGKTFATHHLLDYLLNILQPVNQSMAESTLEIIKQAEVILGVLGNASTTRNDSSSRFSKRIQLDMVIPSDIQGSPALAAITIEAVLLQAGRLIRPPPGESNFFALHLLAQAHLPDLGIQGGSYYYLPHPSSDTKGDVVSWTDFMLALNTFLSQEQADEIPKVIAAILHLGNGNYAMASRCLDLRDKTGTELEEIVSTYTVGKGQERFKRGKDGSQSVRDTISLTLYKGLFQFLKSYIEVKLQSQSDLAHGATADYKCLSIIDISGFESFQKNSLEQLHINHINERLQSLSMTHLLGHLSSLDPSPPSDSSLPLVPNNTASDGRTLQVITCLNDKAISPAATDEDFHHSIPADKDRPLSSNQYPEFEINHYAGNVIYDATGMVKANKVVFPDGLANLLSSSGLNVVRKIGVAIPSTQGQAKSSVGKEALAEINALCRKLTVNSRREEEVRWLRCIRPAVSGSIGWTEDYVKAQLEVTGVTSIIAALRQACRIQMTAHVFEERYGLLGAAQEVLDRYCSDGWRISEGLVCLSDESVVRLDHELLRHKVRNQEVSLFSSSSGKNDEATDTSVDEDQGDSSKIVVGPQNTGKLIRGSSQADLMAALRQTTAALASPVPNDDPEKHVTGEFSMRQMDDEAQESYIEELENQLADEASKVAHRDATITVQADDIAKLEDRIGAQEATISTQNDQLRSGSSRLQEYEDLVLDFLRHVRPPALMGAVNPTEVVGNLCRTVVKAMLSFLTPEGLRRGIEAFDCIKDSNKGGTSVRALFHYRVFSDLMAICDSVFDPAWDINIILKECLVKLAQHVMESTEASIRRTIQKHTGNMRKEGIQGALNHLVENFEYYRTPEALSQAVLNAAMESFKDAAAAQGRQEQKKRKHPLDIEQVLHEWLDSNDSKRRRQDDHLAT